MGICVGKHFPILLYDLLEFGNLFCWNFADCSFLENHKGEVVVQTTVEQTTLGQQDAFVDSTLHQCYVNTILVLFAHLGSGIFVVMPRKSLHL